MPPDKVIKLVEESKIDYKWDFNKENYVDTFYKLEKEVKEIEEIRKFKKTIKSLKTKNTKLTNVNKDLNKQISDLKEQLKEYERFRNKRFDMIDLED